MGENDAVLGLDPSFPSAFLEDFPQLSVLPLVDTSSAFPSCSDTVSRAKQIKTIQF